jgi:hypothetical protein
LVIGIQSRSRPMALDKVFAAADLPDVVSGSPEAGMIVYFFPFSRESAELDHAMVFHVADGKVVDFGTNGKAVGMVDPPGNGRSTDGLLTFEQYARPFAGSAFDTRRS